MTDFAVKIQDKAYVNPLPFGKIGTPERAAYTTRAHELSKAFWEDLRAWLLAAGVPQRYVQKVADIAYDQGHSGGYQEVFIHAQTLADIFV